MDYGDLLSSAWRITWRHKYLWIFGLFASGSAGCSIGGGGPNFSAPSENFPTLDDPAGSIDQVVGFLNTHWALIGVIILASILMGLILFVISVISTGGLVSGSADAYEGSGGSGLGQAWSEGVSSFWRLLGMWITVFIAVGLAVLAVIAVIGVPLVLVISSAEGVSWPAVVLIILAVLVFIALAIPAGIALQICVNWATRSIILGKSGVFASLRHGWSIFRHNIGSSLLVWVISVGLGVAVGLVVNATVIAAAIPVIFGFMPLLAAKGPILWVVVGLVSLIVLAGSILAKATLTTYFSSYWTIAYLKLTTRDHSEE